MQIKDLAFQTGLSPKTIRYYEDIGLVQPLRLDNGYRDFSERDVHNLKFLARARRLGFSVEDCRQLLGLYTDQKRASKDVKKIAQAHLQDIEQKINELESMRATLETLVQHCKGNHRPDCPILNDLAGSQKV